MKKIICLVLILALALPICACGNSETYYQLGETVSTDIFEFTLDEADLAIALNNERNTSFFLPKEYDSNLDANNSYVAPVGHTLVAFTYTVNNINRSSSEFHKGYGSFAKATYNGKEYGASSEGGGKGFEEGAYYLYENKIVMNEYKKMETYKSNTWYRFPSNNFFLSAGNKETRRAFFDIATNVDSLNDEFYITIEVPNSKGEVESFTYIIPERIDEN